MYIGRRHKLKLLCYPQVTDGQGLSCQHGSEQAALEEKRGARGWSEWYYGDLCSNAVSADFAGNCVLILGPLRTDPYSCVCCSIYT